MNNAYMSRIVFYSLNIQRQISAFLEHENAPASHAYHILCNYIECALVFTRSIDFNLESIINLSKKYDGFSDPN